MAPQRMGMTLHTVESTYHDFYDKTTCVDEATGVRSRGRPSHDDTKEAARMSVDPVSVLLWIVAPIVFWGAITAGLLLTLGG